MPTERQKLVIILRGLPGTGKTFIAENYLKAINPESNIILSADDYFVKNGVYRWDINKNDEAYQWNFERFKKAIAGGKELIIIDNTNLKHYHYFHYVDFAQANNYLVIVSIIPHNDVDDRRLAERNIHNVSTFTIKGMRRNFEWQM